MMLTLALAATVIAGAAAAYTDIKTGYIYDWITYPLIGLGIVLSILTQEWIGLVLGAAIYGIGSFAYSSGKMGGGDIKLLTGIALVQPLYEGMIFVLAALLVAALSACAVFGIYYLVQLARSKPTIEWNASKRRALMLLALLGVYFTFVIQNHILLPETSIVLGAALGIGVLFYAFENEIKQNSFLKRVSLKELEDDEVLAAEHLSKDERARFGKTVPGLIGKEDRLRLTHLGFQTIPVYRNLPKFAPFILVGILITYAFPAWLGGIVPTLI